MEYQISWSRSLRDRDGSYRPPPAEPVIYFITRFDALQRLLWVCVRRDILVYAADECICRSSSCIDTETCVAEISYRVGTYLSCHKRCETGGVPAETS